MKEAGMKKTEKVTNWHFRHQTALTYTNTAASVGDPNTTQWQIQKSHKGGCILE